MTTFNNQDVIKMSDGPVPVLATGVFPLPAPKSETACRRNCDGLTLSWRIPSITEDIFVCLGTAETAAH